MRSSRRVRYLHVVPGAVKISRVIAFDCVTGSAVPALGTLPLARSASVWSRPQLIDSTMGWRPWIGTLTCCRGQ